MSLVVSHCITDGVGFCEAVADAATGADTVIGWPAAGSRTRWQAVGADTRQTVRDVPAIGRALAAAARFARRNAGTATAAVAGTPPLAEADEVVALPTATVSVDGGEWDARAAALGGTSNTLLAAFAAHLARAVGRIGADGSVTLTMPISERIPGDTRANAITNVDITVDPAPATADLSDIRARIKQALARTADEPDERWALTPLVLLIPERLGRRWVGSATNSAAAVGASNLGVIDPTATRPDGNAADAFAIRSLTSGMTNATLHQLGGVLMLLSGRANGRVFVSVVGYQPGRPTTNADLRGQVLRALADFRLSTTHTTTEISA